MFVELQDPKARELMYQCHAHAIEEALVIVFQYDRSNAKDAVGAVTRRFDKAPLGTRDAFAHEDPLKIAAEIAQVPATVFEDAQYVDRIKAYDTKVRAAYEKQGAQHYEQWIKPIFEKVILGSVAAPAASAATPVLRRGDKNASVTLLQAKLNAAGYQVGTDGDFGPGTDAAVKQFQAAKGLTADGIVGPATWTALG